MNYNMIYENLIEKARVRRKLPKGDREKHHVVPKCIGGAKGEVVHLLLREHYICHTILVKMHPEHYGLKKAYLMMCDTREEDLGNRIKNSRTYQKIRGEWIESIKGEKSIMFGKKLSEKTKKKMSESKRGHIVTEETKRKIGERNKEKIRSEEIKRKLSEAHKGNILTDTTKRKISKATKGENNPMFGKTPWNKGRTEVYSEESKLKMSISHKVRHQKIRLMKENEATLS